MRLASNLNPRQARAVAEALAATMLRSSDAANVVDSETSAVLVNIRERLNARLAEFQARAGRIPGGGHHDGR